MEAGRTFPASAAAAHNAHIAPKPSSTPKPASKTQNSSSNQNAPKGKVKPSARNAPNVQSSSSAPKVQNTPRGNVKPSAQSASTTQSASTVPKVQNAPKGSTIPNAQSASSTQSVPNAQSASTANAARPANGPRRQKGNDSSNNQRANMIHVSGFPPYTQAVDLGRTFSNFGNVRVEKLNARMSFAILAYTTDAEAQEAIQANKKVNIYGEFVKVRAYTVNTLTPKRDFTRSKQKGVIVEPTEIDLSGDFHQQLDSVLAAVRLTQEEALSVSVLYADLERVLQVLWPGCVSMPFGSITTGLGIKTSDADCYLHVPADHQPGKHYFVNRAKRVLLSYPHIFSEILAIPRANTPIVKFFHIPTETNCDLSFKTPLGSQNSKLIAFLLHADPRLIPMAVFVKYWAKVHGLSGTGRLTNYALTMMIIFYFQQPPMSILPSVEWLQRDPKDEVIVDYWNTGFMSKKDLLPPYSDASSIAELLGGFFEYYAKFDFDDLIVCPFLGTPVKKECFVDIAQIPAEYSRYKENVLTRLTPPLRATTFMCVQDPFEQCHNVASVISNRLASEIKAYLKFAAKTYEKEKLNGCADFLKTILLEKPKIVRAKLHPEYKINLFQRVIGTISKPDWKSVIREAVFTVFETILKIKLDVSETNTNAKKEKEKYNAKVTKAIWKRKQFSRLYSLVKKDFVEKQTRITEEILAIEQETFNLQFTVTLAFTHDPKNAAKTAIVSIKLTNGNVDYFKEFGKFYLSLAFTWLTTLLKAQKDTPDTPEQIQEIVDQIDKNNTLDSDDDDDEAEENNESVDNDTEGPENDISVDNDNDVSSNDEDIEAGGVGNYSKEDKGAAAAIDEHEETNNKTCDKSQPEQMVVDIATPAALKPEQKTKEEKAPDKTSPVERTSTHKAPHNVTPTDIMPVQKTLDVDSTIVQKVPENTAHVDSKQTISCDPVQTDTQTNS